jgi:hypothetical protein
MVKTRNTVRTTAAAIAIVAGCGLGTSAYAAPVASATPTGIVAGEAMPSLGTLTLSELKARVTAAIDRQSAIVDTISERVAASERLSAEAKARIAEKLAARKAALAKLREQVQAQTTKQGVRQVVRDARRDGVRLRGTARPDGDRRDGDRRDGDRAWWGSRDGGHCDGDGDHREGDGDRRDGDQRDGDGQFGDRR